MRERPPVGGGLELEVVAGDEAFQSGAERDQIQRGYQRARDGPPVGGGLDASHCEMSITHYSAVYIINQPGAYSNMPLDYEALVAARSERVIFRASTFSVNATIVPRRPRGSVCYNHAFSPTPTQYGIRCNLGSRVDGIKPGVAKGITDQIVYLGYPAIHHGIQNNPKTSPTTNFAW